MRKATGRLKKAKGSRNGVRMDHATKTITAGRNGKEA